MKMKRAGVFLPCLLLLSGAVFASGDPAKGKMKSALCISCHGANGISNGPLWPNLAGQKSQYLAKQLKDFRSGKRSDPMMSVYAKQLSDADIANLSAYYEQLK